LSFVVITAAAVFMANLDLWVANVALPTTGTAFHESSLARQAQKNRWPRSGE
jgi:hypothetical protein